MKISYNWLSEYLTGQTEPEKLSRILTSVGLEVESLEKFEEIKGGLKGLIIGEVTECIKHPEADKLKLTKVDIGNGEPLQIVCGASNVAEGQKVVVAPIGSTIYPISGEPMQMKKAKIRGIESFGMICAEDEIGMGTSHEGILILPETAEIGSEVSNLFQPYNDWIFEIGLTPNRMDAMSHLGVAKDVSAFLSYHNKKDSPVKYPYKNNFKVDNNQLPIAVKVENTAACPRYAGVSISNVKVAASPQWLQQKLKIIGLKPINNIVDITNFILHETGQPLHAFDATAIKGNTIIVKNLPAGTPFISLDEKEKKLQSTDLMICNGNEEPMCIGGVFGGATSGVSNITTNVFLESAWFDPLTIRKTSIHHGLRTEAAIRFEKGVDISNTINVLKRAAMMIKEIAGGEIASEIIDVYPTPKQKTEVTLKNHYLKKISGKNYHPDAVKKILQSLRFEIIKEGLDDIRVAVPFSNPDISLPADIIEEIMRIDGLDNIEIPTAITISPAVETNLSASLFKEKVANYLIGVGFSEIFTNSITNSKYYDEETLKNTVHILNGISVELDIMKPRLLETGLESIAYNLNRKNNDLLFFEFGKSYSTPGIGSYKEEEHLCLYITGNKNDTSWKEKSNRADVYFAKGVCEKLFALCGLKNITFSVSEEKSLSQSIKAFYKNISIAKIGMADKNILEKFSIKQPVLFADIKWEKITDISSGIKIQFEGIPKFPSVNRDISMIVEKAIQFERIEKATDEAKVEKLIGMKLFDVFESEKIGADKKSLAISFTFSDKEKTLTDAEIDAMMNKIISSYEKTFAARVRRDNN